MSAQLPPTESQRRHWKAYACGLPPFHVPVVAESVWFCCGVPEIAGGLAFSGGPAVEDGWTTPGVAFEFALAAPSAFDAITRERMRWPTSARRKTSVRRVSPPMVLQVAPLTPPPLVSQRSQRYRNASGRVPLHEPFPVLSVCPCTVEPDTCGCPVAFGAVRSPAEPPTGIRSASSSAPTRIARVAMPFPSHSSLSSNTTRGAWRRFGCAKSSYRRITCVYVRTNTGVPSGRMCASLRTAALRRRMQPWLTLEPIRPGSFVPCRPTRPSPPANVCSTFECAERPNEYGPYEPPGLLGCSSSTM